MSLYSGLFSINDERVRSTAELSPGCIKPKIFRAELSCWCKSYVALRMKTSLQNLYVRHHELVDPKEISIYQMAIDLFPLMYISFFSLSPTRFYRNWLSKYHFGCHIRIMNCSSCARIWVLPGGFRVARLLSFVVGFFMFSLSLFCALFPLILVSLDCEFLFALRFSLIKM